MHEAIMLVVVIIIIMLINLQAAVPTFIINTATMSVCYMCVYVCGFLKKRFICLFEVLSLNVYLNFPISCTLFINLLRYWSRLHFGISVT